ncbi:MAG: FxLYD domain-containing protein [Armatimonadota bacterium]
MKVVNTKYERANLMNQVPPTPKPAWQKWLLGCGIGCAGIVVIVIIITIIGAIFMKDTDLGDVSGVAPNAKKVIKATTPEAKKEEGLQLLSVNWVTGDYGMKSIKGVVLNNSDKKYDYVQIEINLYNKEGGDLVGNTMANATNLEPRKKWIFDAPVVEDNATWSEVKDITGW